MTDCQKSNT